MPNLYTYKVKYIKNYDGDTVTLDVDLGFGITNRIIVRLLGINTKELRGTKGQDRVDAVNAKKFVHDKLYECNDIFIKTFRDKKGKYGRYLATIFYYNKENININLCEQLLENGLALPYI